RSSATIIVRLKAGNAPLNDWLYKTKSPGIESNHCHHCHQKEDLNHFFFLCRLYIPQQAQLRQSMGHQKAQSLYHLLVTPEGIRHSLIFIKATDRFPHMRIVIPPENDE
ncbi:hypothetical protein C8J56DRAFT_798152, partial [Mycena floridula]